MLLTLAALALASPPLTIHVDPKATEVSLVCGTTVTKAPVRDGVATFEVAPDNCTVYASLPVGVVPSAGVYACSAGNCALQDVPHAPISDAPGRLNVVLAEDYAENGWMEVVCADGYRKRADIKEHTAVFDELKTGSECTLYWKGGAPASLKHVVPGSERCTLSGTTAVCTSIKP